MYFVSSNKTMYVHRTQYNALIRNGDLNESNGNKWIGKTTDNTQYMLAGRNGEKTKERKTRNETRRKAKTNPHQRIK